VTLASVLVPIHDKTTTLPLTVDTVLRQTVTDLEVILVGDGVTPGVREVVEQLLAADDRVRFLDFPKGPHHGERYRHDAVEAADSDAIFYLCDDDLLLPDHVADLLALLEDHDLVQNLNGYVTSGGDVRLYAADLADPDVVALHLREDVRCNALSITGTAHTRAAYRRVSPWDTTPAGWWPDHWQFRKLLGPGFRAATSARMTALQFPTSGDGRDTWSAEARAEEIVPWHALVTSPGAQDEIDRRVREGMLAQLIEERGQIALMRGDLAWAREQLAAGEARAAELVRAHAEIDRLNGEAAGLWDEIETLRTHVGRLTELRAQHEEKLESLRDRVRRKDRTISGLRSRLRP
jgi:hypothetical protein